MNSAGERRALRARIAPLVFLTALALAPVRAQASFLPPELLDTAADILAIVVLLLVPIIGIVVFWLVHILPEKIAENRHHPQKEAITTLCLLSLVFGGMLWPIAWLWAYTKPVVHRMAYGTDRHDDYFVEMAEKAREGKLTRDELRHLIDELDSMESRGALSPQLQMLRQELSRMRMDAPAAPSAAELQPAGPVAQGQPGGAA